MISARNNDIIGRGYQAKFSRDTYEVPCHYPAEVKFLAEAVPMAVTIFLDTIWTDPGHPFYVGPMQPICDMPRGRSHTVRGCSDD